ncbi:GCN5-related N-acetyltransferase [Rippkaea orientalis PCC 8801]|uniref:GCN5-related N-acetyltransferase n=1 Tax=Rippkaea orientalis (strain PCC 8801 / RF-1) TaxID=41431 RepID=B7K0B1_RIPO1|nr:GNAT family N-acetyltransferase [Rippkaea orientalis]ACK67395.1 GCN5-related N-acetyltransferase [Rippkaea orientalis PCC 8801]
MTYLPQGYQLQKGAIKDRKLLVKFMELTYQELFPQRSDFTHLSNTVDQYLSPTTPLWWVTVSGEIIAGLWMGNAIDQVSGDRYGHIFLIYVTPEHRRQGIATALIQVAEDWVITRGDRRLGLQVFESNQPALNLYDNLGFKTQSRLMFKSL